MTNFTVITIIDGFQPLLPFPFPAAMAQRNSLLEIKTWIFHVDCSGSASQFPFPVIDFSNWMVHVVGMQPLFSGLFVADKTITYCQYSNIKCIVHMAVVLLYTLLQWNIEDFFFLYTTIANHYKVLVHGPMKEVWTEN